MSRARLALAAALAAPLAGCATFATNVNGSFACSAPDGICAPSSVIDDRALALIAGERGDIISEPTSAAPALIRSRAVAPGQVAHAGQKVLRIVFPAHVDRQGRYHEQSAVRAVVDQGTWLAAGEAIGLATARIDVEPAAVEIDESARKDTASATAEPSAEAVRAARARAAAQPLSRAVIAAEVETIVAKPPITAPAGFPARVED